MQPNELQTYMQCEVQGPDNTISIRQFAGIITNAYGLRIYSFIPWNVDVNPALNRARIIEIPEQELHRVMAYPRS